MYKNQVSFYSEKCIRHAFQVFRKSSPVRLTMLQGTFYLHQGTHSSRPKIVLLTSLISSGQIYYLYASMFHARVKTCTFTVLFSKCVFNSEHLEIFFVLNRDSHRWPPTLCFNLYYFSDLFLMRRLVIYIARFIRNTAKAFRLSFL